MNDQPVYDEDTLNSLTSKGETDTSFESLVNDLDLSPEQAEALTTALETAAIDNVDDVNFYQLAVGYSMKTLCKNIVCNPCITQPIC